MVPFDSRFGLLADHAARADLTPGASWAASSRWRSFVTLGINIWMRSVLVIDDVRRFRVDCVHARTVAQAISLLEDPWDEVWFDHDLAEGETVRPAVVWIEQQIADGTKPEIGRVLIHSSNPSGARWIYDVLSRHYVTRIVTQDELRAFLKYD